ncbi:membrane protein insertion efficiency factor YidD [Acetivibrio saccincola]|uniref:Putative membrane protein insertion efficiency factor n=1 Tax=Acetivibrio saccincola TaxID=1677857 RepID=A0A2S8R7Q4_9FIRM|nr:membrane protein insertion efficiency factor YidD [Acetivibrio saccincola]NLW27169.1 membrane protein insertion efficiency factor YidD [Acetivibrio saccincola]PQQ65821.1 membrane protein insertion efficiency factor YidD [Acetivibrio saccincola]HOA97662.1 membrane protein insertion efficiency factor YidD [Acetivibrio saccincola]HQD28933.1 membrane protein insertion efficiency factor YidD [Acetivibrio saccincola]
MLKKIFILPIKFYRKWISPLKIMPCCRFYPTCSQYAIDSIDKYGIIKGGFKSIIRILKCNPFHPGGYDPVE